MKWSNWLFGRPLATEEDEGQRIGPFAGVGVLGLDALASASYGPEALLTVLLPLGRAGLSHLLPIIGAILLLLSIVSLSYRQIIRVYSNGGGAYTVARENLGERSALFAAAALSLDYILNSAVAVSAGVGALVSAIPALLPHTLPLCLLVLLFLTLINLRGVRATGAAFLLPTYLFVAALLAVIATGIFKFVAQGGEPTPVVAPISAPASLGAVSLWVLLRAFSSGCTAMTGIEAVSNGVTVFKEPAWRSARHTLLLITVILMILLAGIAFLCVAYGITATPPGQAGYQSVLSQVFAATVGRGPLYYIAIGSVVTVLVLSANTSFAGFPSVCRILAGDGYLPETFMHRGRRLAFSQGIWVLAALAAVLLIVFEGITENLIHLFAIGALSAFTVSQTGMVAHFRRKYGSLLNRGTVINGLGAIATGSALLIVFASKFMQGAWISILIIGGMLLLFRNVRKHHDFITEATRIDMALEPGPRPILAVVPLRRWDAVSLKALRFALGTAPDVIGVQILTGDRRVEDLSPRWDELVEPVTSSGARAPKLVVVRSEYRQLFAPLVNYIRELAEAHADRQVAVVIPNWSNTAGITGSSKTIRQP